jgi:hypothetical protein
MGRCLTQGALAADARRSRGAVGRTRDEEGNVSPRFSERIGAVKVEVQVEAMNAPLRNSIWNFIDRLIPPKSFGSHQRNTIDMIARDVLRVPVQRVDHNAPVWWLLGHVETMAWAEVYDLLEYAVAHATTVQGLTRVMNAPEQANQILAREHSAYRFVGGKLVPITNATEIQEIEQAAERASTVGLDGVRQQIAQALVLFGQRPVPDYRNAIKEAISSVEGVVKIINGTRGGGLHEALEAVAANIEMHPALKGGLEKLYGYTSDEDGIRHPILEEATVDEADARFMIVTCSAFVNFLIVKAEAAGLLKAQ